MLYKFGGIFVDADEYCIKPISPLFKLVAEKGCDCFAAIEGNPEMPDMVANGMLACSKNNNFMLKMVEGVDIDQPGDTWKIVGPRYLTNMINQLKPKMHIFDAKVFSLFIIVTLLKKVLAWKFLKMMKRFMVCSFGEILINLINLAFIKILFNS